MKYFAFVAALACSSPSLGGVILNAQQVGGDVVIAGGGTLDVSMWTYFASGAAVPRVAPNAQVAVGASGTVDVYTSPTNFTGPSTIGFSGFTYLADSGSGDMFVMQWITGNPRIGVPAGYASGGPLTGSATFLGETFASLGMNEGTYSWTWDTTSGTDSFTLNVVPVPAPAVLPLFALAGLMRQARRR